MKPNGPDPLVRGNHACRRQITDWHHFWQHLSNQPLAGALTFIFPTQEDWKNGTVLLENRYAEIDVMPSKRLQSTHRIALRAIHVHDPSPPDGANAMQWLLLTTLVTVSLNKSASVFHGVLCAEVLRSAIECLKVVTE